MSDTAGTTTATGTRLPTLITPAQLDELFAANVPPVVLDVRWTLPKPDGREDFMLGHIPGALYVSLDDELAGHDHSDPTAGRHPLPDPDDFQNTVRSWGINPSTRVVVYDDNLSLGAARAWWLLRWAGKTDVHVLDGGLRAWRAAGLPLAGGPFVYPETGTFTVMPGSLPTLDAEAAAALASPGQTAPSQTEPGQAVPDQTAPTQADPGRSSYRAGALIDSRAPERYRGETEPMDPQAGHIPGAANRPTTNNVDPDSGKFKAPETLREEFSAALGSADTLGGEHDLAGQDDSTAVTEIGVYCGSGVTACHNLLALDTLGITAALYPASWSGWSSTPGRPVATAE